MGKTIEQMLDDIFGTLQHTVGAGWQRMPDDGELEEFVLRVPRTNPANRADDPVIKRLLQTLREANVQNPDYDEIKRILEEGVDGRYRVEYHVLRSADGSYHIPDHVGDTVKILENKPNDLE